MSLPLPVLERLFARLNATYGRDFMSRYEGQDSGAVKTSWGHELDGYSNNLRPIAWALENLPDRAPNVLEFRAICRRAPAAEVPLLPEPKADPKRIADELAKLAPLRQRTEEHSRIDHKAWAKRLQARDAAGEPLNMNQRRCYRNALNLEAS